MIIPLKLKPAFKDYIWGGNRLARDYNKVCDLPVLAESWEVSTHPDGLCVVDGGEFDGLTLREVLERHPEWVNAKGSNELPVLVKLIDAHLPLSLQVHPADEYALKAEGQPGKNEMWYIMEAEPGAELILGFERQMNKDELRELLTGGDNAGLLQAVHHVPVEKGDFFLIPAGLVHAIGKGIMIAEVQQNSNVTYRVYDYGRTDASGKPRELHIGKAVDVIDTTLTAHRTDVRQSGNPADDEAGNTGKIKSRILADWEYFRCELITVEGMYERCSTDKTASYECLLVTDICIENNKNYGQCVTPAEPVVYLKYDGGELKLSKGGSVFIPAGMNRYVVDTGSLHADILLTSCG